MIMVCPFQVWYEFVCAILIPFFKLYHDFFLSVFDVDIGDGEPIRKLPYNQSGILGLFYFIWFIFCFASEVAA